MRLRVGAAPDSGIANAEIIAEGRGFRSSLAMNAGMRALAWFDASLAGALVELRLTVRMDRRSVTVYAKNIPRTATVAIFGTNPRRFDGRIYHRRLEEGVGCILRCTPDSEPMIGPGCRDCEAEGLVFEVCC